MRYMWIKLKVNRFLLEVLSDFGLGKARPEMVRVGCWLMLSVAANTTGLACIRSTRLVTLVYRLFHATDDALYPSTKEFLCLALTQYSALRLILVMAKDRDV